MRATSDGDSRFYQKRGKKKPLSSNNCNDHNVHDSDIESHDAATTAKVARLQVVVFMTKLEISTTASLTTARQLRHEVDSCVEVEQVEVGVILTQTPRLTRQTPRGADLSFA